MIAREDWRSTSLQARCIDEAGGLAKTTGMAITGIIWRKVALRCSAGHNCEGRVSVIHFKNNGGLCLAACQLNAHSILLAICSVYQRLSS